MKSSRKVSKMTQRLTMQVPKPNKDCLFIDSWCPICFLNNGYKILALTHNKQCLTSLDILNHRELINSHGFILFEDFYKAFDTVEHHFIFQFLNKFGLNSNSCIKLMGGTSPRFRLHWGIRQCCHMFPVPLPVSGSTFVRPDRIKRCISLK